MRSNVECRLRRVGGGLGAYAVLAFSYVISNSFSRKKSEKELNQQLMSMLQVTISMLEELNVSEERIQHALLSTLDTVQDIKDQYGDNIEDEELAKLVQDACANRILTDIQKDADFLACESLPST